MGVTEANLYYLWLNGSHMEDGFKGIGLNLGREVGSLLPKIWWETVKAWNKSTGRSTEDRVPQRNIQRVKSKKFGNWLYIVRRKGVK